MLVAVCSLKGSPGVTTFCVALAARWPATDRCVLVECDPSGGDVATRFAVATSPGLVSLAAATRRSGDPELLWQHTQALPGGLPVVVAPPGADQALAALTALAPERPGEAGVLRRAANAPQAVVIADCGRVDPATPVLPIVSSADVMLLLSRAHADDLAHLAARLSVVGRWSPRPGLLLVGEGHSTAEVYRELGVPAMGRIPEDRQGAAILCGRPGGRGRPSRSALGHAASAVARSLLSGPAGPAGPQRSSAPASQRVPVPRTVPYGGDPPVPAPPPTVREPHATSRHGTAP
ncbi:MAG: chromosome partitioning protein [Pseudonocardiaceae bacterium]